MKFLAVALLSLVLTGCDVVVHLGEPDMGRTPAVKTEYPTVNLPIPARQSNWLGSKNEGSCVHATMISLLRWQNRPGMADYWRHTMAMASGLKTLLRSLTTMGYGTPTLQMAILRFLEWACSTRRGCGVTVMGGKHMIALVHLDSEWAGILDNNDIDTITWVPRDTFMAEWQNSNGWAVTPIYSPAPPLP